MDIRAQLKAGTVHLAEGSRVELAKAAPANPDDPRAFSMLAYSGNAVKQWGSRVVFDMDGIDMSNQVIPILKQHDPSQVAGKSAKASLDKKSGIMISGTMSKVTAASKEICDLADEDFPWQASVGLDIDGDLEYVPSDKKVKLNGRTFQGPLYVAGKSTLRECSFVPLGADGATKSMVLSADSQKGVAMEGDEVKEARKKYFDGLTVSEFKLAAPALYDVLRAEFKREDSQRTDNIRGLVGATGLPANVQGRIASLCANLSLEDAKLVIAREERIELALAATGFDEKQLAILRADLAGMPVGMAVDTIRLCVDKSKGVQTRLVNTTDAALTGSDVNVKIVEAVKVARVEFQSVVKNIPTLKESDYVEQALSDAKLKYTPADLKSVAPDLFK